MNPDGPLEAAEGERPRRCPACGIPYATQEDDAGCPVCLLRRAMQPEATVEDDLANDGRFDQYEMMRREDGAFEELGRGAMGVTYKAFDVDLRFPVTLKLINEKYVGDESARLRFLREARAAASVRHPNVASVFHLGRTGKNYFYAMEFVPGETLENLIRRSGRLEVKLATGNYDTGRLRFGCGAQAEAHSLRHQAKQHHCEPGG